MTYAFALILLLLALPLLAEALRRPANPAGAPGQFAALPLGRTHYRWSGPETGPVAVCIHGLSTPSYVFAATESALNALGYRVLSYDLYGRGYSANPPAAQGARFFNMQLDALLADQGVDGPVTLVGYSMGGAIATSFAARQPSRVRALVLIAPAGLMPVYDDWIGRLWTMPILGDWATRVLGGIALRRELIEHRTSATVIPDFEDRQARETRRRGYLPAILSSRRHMLSEDRATDHRTVAAAGLPVLAIWGTEDPIIPLKSMGRLAELNPDAHHKQIPGAGHLVLQTHPAQVAEALRRSLKS